MLIMMEFDIGDLGLRLYVIHGGVYVSRLRDGGREGLVREFDGMIVVNWIMMFLGFLC
jgi:hypothetical protein